MQQGHGSSKLQDSSELMAMLNERQSTSHLSTRNWLDESDALISSTHLLLDHEYPAPSNCDPSSFTLTVARNATNQNHSLRDHLGFESNKQCKSVKELFFSRLVLMFHYGDIGSH